MVDVGGRSLEEVVSLQSLVEKLCQDELSDEKGV